MTISKYYPPSIYRFLLETAHDNHLAIKEVETIFLRKQAELLGFSCEHSKIGFAKSNQKPYCKDCWTRLKQVKPPIYVGKNMKLPGEFLPLGTFLDKPPAQIHHSLSTHRNMIATTVKHKYKF